jgi:Arc/MetJ-type ribon-helix-helix transcriptional regulator
LTHAWEHDTISGKEFMMAYQFPPDIKKSIQSRIDSGDYQSEEDVLRTAMQLLEQREKDFLQTWNENNQTAIEQSQQGLSKPLDDEAVLARMRSRLAEEGITS